MAETHSIITSNCKFVSAISCVSVLLKIFIDGSYLESYLRSFQPEIVSFIERFQFIREHGKQRRRIYRSTELLLSFAQVRFLCLFYLNIYLYTVKTSGNFINNSCIVMCSTFLNKITVCDRGMHLFSRNCLAKVFIKVIWIQERKQCFILEN